MQKTLPVLTDFLLALAFSYAALSKLADLPAFFAALGQFPVLRYQPLLFGWLLILAELTAACLTGFPKTRKAGLLTVLVLLACFTFFLLFTRLLVPHMPCPCGGILQGMGWGWHIVLNLLLAAGAYYNLRSLRNKREKPKTLVTE